LGRLRCSTAGESHGPAEVAIIEGIPAGLALTAEDIDRDLRRRQSGYGRGGRMAIESDSVRILAGVRQGRTLGTPIALLVENRDHANWRPSMQPEPPRPGDLGPGGPSSRLTPPGAMPVTVPRPGHADLAGLGKYDHRDLRDVLERASARETVGRVASGAVAKRMLNELGVRLHGRVVSIGSIDVADGAARGGTMNSLNGLHPESIDWDAVEASPFAVSDPDAEDRLREAVDAAREAGESLGGVFEIWAWGLCPGLGSYAQPRDRLGGKLMGAVGSIPAIKGVEIGVGFRSATLPGSQVHDPIVLAPSEAGTPSLTRETNRAGGLEGGMTNGMPLVVRAAMKPIPTLTRPLPSVDLATMTPVPAHRERSDVMAVPAARVVGEAMVALELADAYLEKFGGDSMTHLVGAVRTYEARLEAAGLWRRS
jgi:chorismate synthase